MSRINFTLDTKRILAQRAAYRCSLPECGRLTVGPGHTPRDVVINGDAAHIFSASPAGPRGWGGLPESDLRSILNGIWLCADHARIVDANKGNQYPPELLQSYKALHEAKISREQGGLRTPMGWVQQIEVQQSPLFLPGTTIRFGKVTVLEGRNCVGKTSLCEWLAGFADPSILHRWRRRGSELSLKATFYMPEKIEASLAVGPHGQLTYFHNGSPSPFLPHTPKVIFLQEAGMTDRKPQSEEQEAEDELAEIGRRLGVSDTIVEALIEHSEIPVSGLLSGYRVEKTDEGRCLRVKVAGQHDDRYFGELSTGGAAVALIEVAAALAGVAARYQPTVLAVDGWIDTLIGDSLYAVLELLCQPANSFQTIIVSRGEINRASFSKGDWQVVDLEKYAMRPKRSF
jgi:hypothetical protein